jgi:hypothetical protein
MGILMTDTTPNLPATQPAQQAKVPVRLTGQLDDLDQAWRLAVALAQADILPQDLRGKPANVFLTILYGQQLNVPHVIALQTISVVKGRPQMAGKLLLAKVREAGHKAYVPCTICFLSKQEHRGADHPYEGDHDESRCTVTIVRGDSGEEHSETFTIDDAIAANLVRLKEGKPYARSKSGEPLPWETWTKRMLLWRAAGFCADFICPEVRMGFAIEGEMDSAADDDRPTLAQVAAERDQPATVPPAPEQDDAVIAEAVAELAKEHLGGETVEPDEEALRLFAEGADAE